MPRRGENIYKRKDGRWEGRYIQYYKEDGRAKYASVYGHSYGEVKEKLSLYRSLQRKNQKQNCKLTVAELLELWLADRYPHVKHSSHACYTALVERHILPQLGMLPVRELTVQKVEQYLTDMKKRGRKDHKGGLSPKTISDIFFVLKSALKLAKRQHGFTDINGVMELKGPTVPKRRIEVFGEYEITRMSELLLSNWDINHASLFLTLNTGIRLGELCGLRWSDFDVRENQVRIARTVQRIQTGKGTRLIVQSPKTDSSERIIPLHPRLIRMLLELCRNDDPKVYLLSGTNHPLDPRTIQYRFRKFLKDNSLTIRNFHVLRHSFASRCIEKGMDVKCLSEILGHSNIKTTMQLYVHPSMAKKRAYLHAVCTIPNIA